MPRYIDAELLESKYREGTDPQDPYSEITYLLPEDVESIPTADVEPVKGWISVKERLPENDGKYLCYLECGDVCQSTFDSTIASEGEEFPFGEWVGIYNSDTLGFEDSYWEEHDAITHWMPLPEPPKEEDGWVDDESMPNEDMIPDNELIGGW